MRAIIRQRTQGQDKTWPVLALLIAIVIVPTACLLWFLNKAVKNERLAVRQKLVEVYRSQLSVAQEKLANQWQQNLGELDALANRLPAPALFARLVLGGQADAVVCFDTNGTVAYPTPTAILAPTSEAVFAEADRLESEGASSKAAEEFARVARESSDANIAARALQGQARCLAKAGQKDAALRILTEELAADRFATAVDLQGRLVAANAELRALELIGTQSDARFPGVFNRLAGRLADYDKTSIPAPQRRFLMARLQPLAPERIHFPTREAEELAAVWLETSPNPASASDRRTSPLTNTCAFASGSGRVVVLRRCDKLLASIQDIVASDSLPSDVEITAVSPEEDLPSDSLVTASAAPSLPGWRLALSPTGPGLFDDATNKRVSTYFWITFVVVDVMCILAVIVLNRVRRQMASTRLKNDLVANVTHELKTPLSSMRLLVDTLLNADKLNEHTAREYLQLIAKENSRLSRLIDNFLTFSRMERNKHVFDFAEVAVARIVDGTVAAVRERFNTPGCRFTATTAPDLPPVVADADALVTALLNLLDNACKYSGEEKQIALRARAENGKVLLAVQDNGIGLSPREAKKVFKRFYQVDQTLSRETGGCGLGLSLVQYIMEAHKGDVRVESEPGRGSTFTLVLPAARKHNGS
jgi:signal transduction histidine kinase